MKSIAREFFPGFLFFLILSCTRVLAEPPQLIIHNDGKDGNLSTTIKNDLLSFDLGQTFGTNLQFQGRDLVGNATGSYASYDGAVSNLNYTSATISFQTATMLDVSYNAIEGSVHFVLFNGLPGFYSYFVNAALGSRGEFRTLYRLAPDLFPNGRTYLKDAPLPLWADILTGVKVQDETWQRPDGSYVTKYDNSFFMREGDFHGVYGEEVGAWVLNPGKDYYNGDQMKQELSVHRESGTGDAVLLNMLHGTHFETGPSGVNPIPPGKVFGPWLVYLNNGSISDASARYAIEEASWPYSWFNTSDHAFHARGTVRGQLLLDTGAPAAGTSVFLGSAGPTLPQGTTFQYTATADAKGKFVFSAVRAGQTWVLQAWGADGVGTTYTHAGNISVSSGKTTELGKLTWEARAAGRKGTAWQIGAFDRKSTGFAFGAAPYTHGLVDNCPAALTFVVGESSDADWCFGKSAAGTWSVLFNVPASGMPAAGAVLTLSIAGFSGSGSRIGGVRSALEVAVNGHNLGNHPDPIATDPCLYRSGTTAGEWHYFEFTVSSSAFKAGANTLTLTTTNATAERWRGIMWDMLRLEWL